MNKNQEKLTSAAVIVLVLCCLAYIATMFLRACPAILATDLMETFKASATEVALFSSATLLAYGLMQMPAGIITDAIGGRKTITLFMFLAAIGTVGFAFAPSLEVGVAARFVKGLCLAAVPPIGAVLAMYFPAGRYTQAVGIFMGTGGVGTILASAPLAHLSIAVGWRNALAIVAMGVALIGVAFFLIIKEKPASAAARQKKNVGEVLRGIGRNMRRVFKSRQFWYLAIGQVFTASTFFAFMTMWAGPYLRNAYGMSKIEASDILLFQGLGALVIVPLIATMADRLNSRRGMLILCSVLGCLSCCGLAFFSGQLPTAALVFCIMVFSSCSLSSGTCAFSIIRNNFPGEMTGTGIGCVNMFWPMFASVFNVIVGAVLSFFMNRAGGAAAMDQAGYAQVYGNTFILFVGMWAIASLIAIVLLKEKFEVR